MTQPPNAATFRPQMDPLALIAFPNIDPIAFSIGPFAVRWYALSYIAGLVFAVWYMRRLVANPALWERRTPTATPRQIDDMFVWVTLGVVLGGRAGYVLFYNFGHFLADPLSIVRVWEGGMSFHGGFLGVVVALYLYGKRIGATLDRLLDLCAAAVPVGLGLGRLANFINGELYGRPADIPWAMIFPADPAHLPRHPSQLYEALLEGAVLFLVLRIATHRFKALAHPGRASGIFALGYGLSRILVEFFREPDAQLGYFLGFITMGMILSLPLIAIGIWLLVRYAPHMTAALQAIIARIIRDEGPMPLDRYMQLCLGHPEHGYYMKRDPFGEAGDFITAPEISQMFGELIGIWCAQAFQTIGAPTEVNVIELGPGRGTLMRDVLRAAKLMPGFERALRIHLVETSPALRNLQEKALEAPAVWHDGLSTLPEGPSIIIANEFFDAIPIRQFECRNGRWMERRVGLDADGRLTLGLVPSQRSYDPQPDGTVIEASLLREALARALGARVAAWPSAALIIDYGHVQSAPGDTLQAVSKHRYCGILDNPGESDLTSHVDFEALAAALAEVGAAVHGPMTQRQFLLAMGLEARATALSQNASPPEGEIIARAFERLAGEAQMGNLFKVVAATTPGIEVPYPFGSHDRGP